MSTPERVRADVEELFTLLASNPQGMFLTEMVRDTGWDKAHVRRTIRRLRLIFGDDGEVNLICDPLLYRGEWVYRLSGNFQDARDWLNNRQRDMDSRLRTVHSVAKTVVRGTAAGTVAGKRARLTVKVISRLIEDLAEVGA
jgi:hypothetical protein